MDIEKKSSRIKFPILGFVGIALILISHQMLMVWPRVASFSGPNPAEYRAQFKFGQMIDYMIYIPMLALGIMWAIRGRPRRIKE